MKSPFAVLASYRGLSGASTFGQDALNSVLGRVPGPAVSDPYQTQGEELLAKSAAGSTPSWSAIKLRDRLGQAAHPTLDDGGRHCGSGSVLHPPAVAALPWETLHDPRRNQSFAADTSISLVRTQNLVQLCCPPPCPGGAASLSKSYW